MLHGENTSLAEPVQTPLADFAKTLAFCEAWGRIF